MLCPGGLRGPSMTKTQQLNEVLIANQEDPCADTSHVTSAQDPDELYGSLVAAEEAAPHMPILAVSLQAYLNDLCSGLLGGGSMARVIQNATDGSKEWAC